MYILFAGVVSDSLPLLLFYTVSAAAGVMGGSVSHEYHFPAAVGEAKLLICESCGYGTSLESCVPSECPECGHGFLKCCPGIEVIFVIQFNN